MGILDIFKRQNKSDREVQIETLGDLDPSLGSAFAVYMQNITRLNILTKEASQHYQLIKSMGRMDQNRAMEPFFRDMLALVESQRKLIEGMHSTSVSRKFRMAKDLKSAITQTRHTEDVLRRICSASGDPAINRLQGVQVALQHYRSMERSVLLPALQ
jgi:uncharacterized protein YyaL (SSP411 family)